jgi:hypothetical protein
MKLEAVNREKKVSYTGEEYLYPAATSEQPWQVGAIAALTKRPSGT